MAQREYGSKRLKRQIILKMIILLLLIGYLNNKNSNLFLKLLSEDKNITTQITILLIFTIFIIYTLVVGKIDELPSKYYYSILIFIYMYFILYLFILFLNNLYNYNDIFVFGDINLSKFLMIITVIASLVFSILERVKYSTEKNIIVDLVVKDNKIKSNKFNIFLDTCINFIIMFIILSTFLKIIK